jgi:sigma-B regulation protein RsbU (phosphoserine phosphatase)
MKRLLADFDDIFDLSYRTGDTSLGELVKRAIAELPSPLKEEFGSEGQREEIASESGRFVSFYYRPHLFPGMDIKLRLAHALQYQLLPRELPSRSPVSISAVLESYCHLSGDLFGWEMLHDGKLLVWIADMAGHGIRAGLASAILRVLVGGLRERGRIGSLLSELNRALNHCIRPEHDGLFATMFVMTLDRDGQGAYGSAGHPPILVHRGTSKIEELRSLNQPIGLFPDTTYDCRQFRLDPSDCILLYTDGLVEATGFDNEPFGIERLRRLVRTSSADPRQLTEAIYSEISERQDIDKLEDDVTFLAAMRSPKG